jgi:hypothetical protein
MRIGIAATQPQAAGFSIKLLHIILHSVTIQDTIKSKVVPVLD